MVLLFGELENRLGTWWNAYSWLQPQRCCLRESGLRSYYLHFLNILIQWNSVGLRVAHRLIQTVLALAFQIPTTLSCHPFWTLSALPLLVFGLCVHCWFWSSLVHHGQPQGTAQLISGSYSYCSWSAANFLEHASLPEIWFCLHSAFHLIFYQGDTGTPVISVHLLQWSFAILPCLSLMLLVTATPFNS